MLTPLDYSCYYHDADYESYARSTETLFPSHQGKMFQVLLIIGSERRIAYKRGILVSSLNITPTYEVNYRIQFPFGGELVVCVPQQLQRNHPVIHLLAGILPGGKEEALANDWHPLRLRCKYDNGWREKRTPITDLLISSPPMTLSEINIDVRQ